MDLYKNTHNVSQIEILTCHSDHTRKFFKSFVQLNTDGLNKTVAFSQHPTKKTCEESLEVLVEALRKTIEANEANEANEMNRLRSARETLDKASEAEASKGSPHS